MDTETLNKPVNLHNLSLAIAKTQADYTRIIDSTANELVAINQGSDNVGKVLSVNNNGRVEATSPTQSDWTQDTETDPSYILNRPAIRAGEGENSILIGQIEQDENAAVYTIYITGDANATTYSYTPEDALPNSTLLPSYGFLYCENALSSRRYQPLQYLNTSNHSITLPYSLSSSSLDNVEAKIYFKYKRTIGKYSYAEGYHTVSVGVASHTEGHNTKSCGSASHTEGSSCISFGTQCHSEGSATEAHNIASHAEGYCTKALSNYSHSEGQYTIANGKAQHVQGKYNIEDTSNIYADIVGNGTFSARSNAYTLDWNGNGWFAGKVSAGTTETPATPANANDLTTKQYVDNAIAEVSGIQSDWDESDSTKSSYVLNRPLWLDKYSSTVIFDQTIELNDDNPKIFYYIGDGVLYNYRYEFLSVIGMLSQSSGDVATVTFDGVEYKGYLNTSVDDGLYEFSYQDTQHPPINIKLSKNSITLQLNIVSSSSLSGVFSLTLPYAEAHYDSKYSSIFESTVHYIPVTLNNDGSCTSDVNLNYIYNLLDKQSNVILQLNTGDANYPLFLYLTNRVDAPGLEFTGFDHNLRWTCLWTASKITLTSTPTITIKTWTASDITG